ncbi:hypothetical protein DTO012A7_2998 [Penicillium roqueforti]|uniref:uncharacterized protein n=1 Tax=Penicillium roqueforti TaxID=5082 RepID=UPI00190AD503|nr:uncharacterized protein LCP9604111_5039 [Penicillium roqueforti]KAF9248800.1 hypothetical protein LCP9604111_5039 [Penicillium roqueforti]KAI2689034.1 hypothetical protein LCP963914a_2123 [Penicillium roqueforti]KAI2719205.1 hypothetical protein CBS147318_4315 [Penicillium roqueforti]KAI3177356.1 hypothetical protein DTO039G3_715 [Penicillium roqueforti]KAI3230240.1 hypothetical protein CBS147310_6361 [Penicillium roqueforti]
MSEGPSDLSSSHLEPPSRTTEMQDPGAGDHIASESEDEHFSDASEGNPELLPQSGRNSPIPRTRVERVDSSTQHGEIPGTAAFEKREQDAVPDEVEVIPEGSDSQMPSPADDQSLSPEGLPFPRTVVEKVDPDEPSHGEVPGTLAHEQRLADAVPDVVTKASDSESSPTPPASDPTLPETDGSSIEIPETRLERVDTAPADEDLPPHPQAHKSSASDALPDTVETVPDVSIHDTDLETKDPSLEDDMNDDHGYEKQEAGDDFDEFVEEQEDMGDDDFGDFDDGFQEPSAEEAPIDDTAASQQSRAPPPLIDFDTYTSTSALLDSLKDTLDILFPETQDISSLPPVEPIPDSAAIFSTERSLSLWSQLVAPPPLQPQNWVKSRIRRLFLVSLGVPVDLDEILPASKQKKLVLPSIDLEGTGAKSPGARSASQVRKEEGNDNTGEKGQAPSRQKATSRRGAPPAPEIDLSAVRRLCATTDAALSGLTDSELRLHVHELEHVAQRASSVLEYWLKRRDGLVGEKEAFEGVIENLVSHVRRVRK